MIVIKLQVFRWFNIFYFLNEFEVVYNEIYILFLLGYRQKKQATQDLSQEGISVQTIRWSQTMTEKLRRPAYDIEEIQGLAPDNQSRKITRGGELNHDKSGKWPRVGDLFPLS